MRAYVHTYLTIHRTKYSLAHNCEQNIHWTPCTHQPLTRNLLWWLRGSDEYGGGGDGSGMWRWGDNELRCAIFTGNVIWTCIVCEKLIIMWIIVIIDIIYIGVQPLALREFKPCQTYECTALHDGSVQKLIIYIFNSWLWIIYYHIHIHIFIFIYITIFIFPLPYIQMEICFYPKKLRDNRIRGNA